MLTKVVIIEDELFVVLHLSKLINSLGYKVVETYHSAEDFLAETNWGFDVALIDIFLEGKLTGIDAAKSVREKQKPFIFLTANQDTETINAAANLAPAAYLSKPFNEIEVEAALKILTLRLNSTQIDPFYIHLQKNDFTDTPLTLREIDVLKYLIKGLTNVIMSEKLFISKSTVKTHLRNIYKKFKVGSKKELIELINDNF